MILALMAAPPAIADLDGAQLAYREGRWQEAAAVAQTAGGPDGYAFAAGALIAQLMVEPDHQGREDLAERALDLAEYAYRLDRDHVEARLRLAAAIGYRGRFMNGFTAYVRRMPHRGRRLLEGAVADDPDNAWAVGMLGAWHLEVARRGGARGLDMLDASVEAGIGYYTNAIALDPHNPAPRYFLAIALLALDDEAHYPMAQEQAAIAARLQPRDAFEAGIRDEAELLNALISDRDAATQWADDRLRM